MSVENEKLKAEQKWIGQSFKQKNGYIATVIDYENSKNVTIQFNDEEKTIRTGIRAELVKKGIIGLKPTVLSVKTGERYLQNCGKWLTVIEIKTGHDVTVQFDDGKILYHKYSNDITRGLVRHPDVSFKSYGEHLVDHLGNVYSTQKEMCEKYNIPLHTYRSRRRKGWKKKDALETPVCTHELVVDHLGNTFISKEEMYKHYNIKESCYRERLARGWTQEKALTTPTMPQTKKGQAIGQTYKQRCGLSLTIIEYKASGDRKSYIAEFDDINKTRVKNSLDHIKHRSVGHSDLNFHNQTRNFYGFKTFGVPQIMGEDTFYKAVFIETGEEFCMTPYMMMEYYKENQKNK